MELEREIMKDDLKSKFLHASEQGHKDIVDILITQGVDINTKNADGMTALMFAARQGLIELTSMLIRKGTDVNAKDNYGKTALLFAAHNGCTDIVSVLFMTPRFYKNI